MIIRLYFIRYNLSSINLLQTDYDDHLIRTWRVMTDILLTWIKRYFIHFIFYILCNFKYLWIDS